MKLQVSVGEEEPFMKPDGELSSNLSLNIDKRTNNKPKHRLLHNIKEKFQDIKGVNF